MIFSKCVRVVTAKSIFDVLKLLESLFHALEFRSSICMLAAMLLPFDEAVAYRAIFCIVSGSVGRAETLLEPAT